MIWLWTHNLTNSLSAYKTLFPYLRRYRFRYIAGFAFLIVVDAAQMIIPYFLQRAVDLIASGNFAMKQVVFLAAAMVIMMAVISAGRFLWRYFIHGSSRRIEAEMRAALFDHLLTLSYDFYQKSKIGDLMARATNDLSAVRTSIGMGLVALVDGTVMAVSILVIIFASDAKSAAFAVIPLPFITLLILLFGKLVGKRFQRAQETYSSMSGIVQETFAGIRVVKSFVKEWSFLRRFADTNDDYRKANMALAKLYGGFFPLIFFFSGLTSVILLLVGGIRVVEGFMSPGQLTALFRYLQMLIWPLMGAGFMVNLIQRGAVSLSRINEVMQTKPLVASPENPLTPAPAAAPPDAPVQTPASSPIPCIEFRSLSFCYGDSLVLQDISFSVEAGEWLGILGRTGSGKSSLIKTLTRTIEPPAGTVFVKGIDVRDWDLGALRGLFGVTPQDSYLFSDSIKNNIAYGVTDSYGVTNDCGVTGSHKIANDYRKTNGCEPAAGRISENQPEDTLEAALEKAAALSAIDQDLHGFSQGWDTIIGERGLTLSGGQKQRVSVSRAIIKGGEFLILDDSLSAVDAETEKKILSGLVREMKGKTVIIISHRISTLCNADKVLVLDKGRIAEYGAPARLIANDGFYAKMAALQQLENGGILG
jgi:ATP-binding cassette subfamily B protein